MIRGIYSAANGLLVESARTDIISGNLAGASVSGFRRSVPIVSGNRWQLGLAAAGAGRGGGALLDASSGLDLSPGPTKHTGRRLDLALEGSGYFCVQTRAGVAYTRGGAFHLDSTRRLVTAAGLPVLGENGPIAVDGSSVEFRENGDVVVDGEVVDRLRLVDLPRGARPIRLQGGLLQVSGARPLPAAQGTVRVRQGYLEEANVNAVVELAEMISALRAFEASQRVLQANDETLDRIINEVGRV